jgi:hypothetical protein
MGIGCLACNNYHGLKLKEKFGTAPFMADLMEDYMVVALELSMLTSSIRKQV